MFRKDEIQAYMGRLRINNCSPNTIRAYKSDLEAATEWIAANQVTGASDDMMVFEYFAAHDWAPSTQNRKLAAMRGCAKHNYRPPLLDGYRPAKVAPPQPHPIPEGIQGVVDMIDSSRNPRHRSLVALCGLLGLRVDEAVNVIPAHFDIQGNERWLRVIGKGNKTRILPVSDAVWAYIEPAYKLAQRETTSLVRLSNRGARHAIKRHARNAGLSRDVSSHDMRATFATAAYEKTHDLRAVQELLGHADPKTTQVYTQSSQQARRAAAAVI